MGADPDPDIRVVYSKLTGEKEKVMFDLRYVYVGRSSRGLVKIGIAHNVARRWNDIDRSTPGTRERPTFAVRVFGARQIEKTLHAIFFLFRRRHKGSGKTEWFYFPFPLNLIVVPVIVVILILARLTTLAAVFAAVAFAAWLIVKNI